MGIFENKHAKVTFIVYIKVSKLLTYSITHIEQIIHLNKNNNACVFKNYMCMRSISILGDVSLRI